MIATGGSFAAGSNIRRAIMSARAAPAPVHATLPATYTTAEVATLLKCSGRNVRRQTDAGEIAGARRFGRLVRYSREAVDRWLAGEGTDADRPDVAAQGR